MNANVHLVKGVICSYRVEAIDECVLKQSRCIGKLVDELAKGKRMENILRAEKQIDDE